MADLVKLDRLLTFYIPALEKSNISSGILAEEGPFFMNYTYGVLGQFLFFKQQVICYFIL